MKLKPNYLKERLCLNVLAGSVENAKECYTAAEGYVLVGVLSKNYSTDEEAIFDMKRYAEVTENALSIGLGAGDPNQSAMVTRLAKVLQPQHVNQVFTGVGASRESLGQNETVINGLISPTGRVGYVNVATGSLSSKMTQAEVPIETAIALLQDMGGSSVKYFPMNGLAHKEEYQAVAKACAEASFYLEPTGGIDLNNFEEIVTIALESGVEKIIPHVYSSIMNDLGLTRPEDVETLYEMMKKIV